ncbi:MAG: GNAT family N-acetyltransferase [Candidatus Hodarchaeota archaeon]
MLLSKMVFDDLPFLINLWHDKKVMRYADEFPRFRGWSKSDDIQTAWRIYQEKHKENGNNYVQLILRLDDGNSIGESFFISLPEGYKFGKWLKPPKIITHMGDIKLLPKYWGKGLGTQGMKEVVQFMFSYTKSDLLIVPPHRLNPAASKVYGKAGFVQYIGMRSWRNHKIMELSRERFNQIY